MNYLFKSNLISKTKWKLLTWLYYIFFIKSVLSVGLNRRKACTANLWLQTIPFFQSNQRSTCFIYNTDNKLNNNSNLNVNYKRNKILEDKSDTSFNLNVYNFTHNRNFVDRSAYWSSYYNRSNVQTHQMPVQNRHFPQRYNPQIQPMNRFYNGSFPVMNPYPNAGMNYYNQQLAPPIRQPYPNYTYNQPNIFHQIPPSTQTQPSPPLIDEFHQHRINQWVAKKDLEEMKQNKYRSFSLYTDIIWCNDDEDKWPGVSKIKPGEYYPGIIHYYFTPFDALVLLVDKKVEGSTSISDLPPAFSKCTIKDSFKIDHLIKFKLKDPIEFDEKGRPKFVPCLDNIKKEHRYRFGSRVRGTPIFFTNTMAVFKLEDNESYAQISLVNTGIFLTFPVEYKMTDLFEKGEVVEMEIIKLPIEPKICGYLCRIPFDSEKGRELKEKYKMITDVFRHSKYSSYSERPSSSMDQNEDYEYESDFKKPKEDHNYYFNEFEHLLPFDSESCSLKDFIKRIGGNLKLVLSFISLKTKTLVNPSTNISKTMAKIILNFVKDKNIFEIDKEEENFEFEQFKGKSDNLDDDRRPVVAILGGPGEGKSSLFRVLSGSQSDPESNFNFAKVNHKFPITVFDTPGNELLAPIRDNILKSCDMALILISAETGITKNTLDSVNTCKSLKIPFIFVLTKFDKSVQSNVEGIISKLSSVGISLEQMGGEHQMISFSTVEDVEASRDSLIDAIILQSSLADRPDSSSDLNASADGYVLDSGKIKNHGFYSLILVKNGSIKKGDNFISGSTNVKIKSIRNSEGELVKELRPSECGYAYGFDKDTIPDPGSSFQVFDKDVDSTVLTQINEINTISTDYDNVVTERINDSLDELDQNEDNDNVYIPVLIKSDVKAIAESVKVAVERLKCNGISKTCRYKVMESSTGNLKQEDTEALGEKGLVIAFNSPVSNTLENKLSKQGISVISGNDIVEIVQKAEEELGEHLGERKLGRLVGTAQILKLFEASKKRKAAGCVVTYGRFEPFYDYRVMRDDKFLYYGKISSLRRTTEEASEILETESCGITFQDFNDFKVGDVIEAYVD